MQFKEGAEVVTAEGKKVGSIDRVVLTPDTKEVTHLVVEKGFLFTEDKVVPLSLIGPVTEDQVTLRDDAGDLDELPDFDEPAPQRLARPMYWYPPVGSWRAVGAPAGYTMPQYVVRTERNIPEGTVALEEGAKVISRDGEHVGDVERIFTESQENRATHLLIAEGLFLKERKLIPTSWMSTVLNDEVHLSVKSDLIDSLPEYLPAEADH